MRVRIDFAGEPFDRQAVLDTLRHLAMRVGWQLTTSGSGDGRIVYAATEDPEALNVSPRDILILSSPRVAEHLSTSREPIPLAKMDNRLLPFPRESGLGQHPNWIGGDVIAGAYAAMNLWYEQRACPLDDGWITWRQDWMALAGLPGPLPLADEWLGEIKWVADELEWPSTGVPELFNRLVVVLTHDVDYMPGRADYGLPRLVRACARQLLLRHNPMDAGRLLARYVRTWSRRPYWPFSSVMQGEGARGACSSFQIVPTNRHRLDPGYHIGSEPLRGKLPETAASDWEICLHGSYTASRTPGRLVDERMELERVTGAPVLGHRQHYLNFTPAQLFKEVERADLKYDMSVGYNDMSGARAGTYFPYRPFQVDGERSYRFWEIPFILMDTTLATSYRLTPRQGLEHSQAILEPALRSGGCISLIWHLEQLSGLIDPGFEHVYYDLLDWIASRGGVLTTGRAVLPELEARWRAALAYD